MYVVLTSKVNEYDATPERGLTVLKTFDYYFYDRCTTAFSIAHVDVDGARVRIAEIGEGGTVNSIPVKFFEAFDSLEEAEAELQQLTLSPLMRIRLEERAAA